MILRFAAFALFVSSSSTVDAEEFTSRLIERVSEVAERRLSVSYPSIEEWTQKLLTQMPSLSGKERTQAEFEVFRRALGRHGKTLEDFNALLLETCERLNGVDKEASLLARIKWIGQSEYEEVRESVIAAKRSCDATKKAGNYWRLYDEAYEEITAREQSIEAAINRCERDFPQTCL